MVSLTLKILFKKIENKRRDVALKKMGNQPTLALLFRKETISDWEDQPIPEKPKRIIPLWRSPAFKMCIQKLDQIALRTTNSTSELKSLTLLLEQNKEPIQRPEPILSEIPQRLPADAYDAGFYGGLSAVEKEHLDPITAIGLEGKACILNEMTVRQGQMIGGQSQGSSQEMGGGASQGPTTGS